MTALLFYSLMIPISLISSGSTFYFIFSLFGVTAFFLRNLKISGNNSIEGIVHIFILSLLFSLSCFNGASPLLSVLKSFQFFILLKVALIASNRVVVLKDIQQVFLSFFILSILFSPFSLIGLHPGEPIRLMGFLYDPNYFGITCFMLLVVSHFIESTKNVNFKLYNFLFVLGIILSLSATVYLILIFYKMMTFVGSRRFLNWFSVPFVMLGLLTFPFAPLLAHVIILELNQFNDMSFDIFTFKLTSLNQRFDVQLSALILIFDNLWNFAFGFGSGRTLEFLPRALHNGYLQLLFAHGFIVYMLFVVVHLILLNIIRKKYSGERHLLIGFCSLLLANNFLDVFFSGLISIFFLLSSVGFLVGGRR